MSALWLHTDKSQHDKVMSHIYKLIDRVIEGDMTVIPKIHWWYVHLAPTCRGSGSIAEMTVNTLCRLHGIDLPPWKKDIAPALEVLLEPNEDRFCRNYYKLFADESLKGRFDSNE